MQRGATVELQCTNAKGGSALHEAVYRRHYHLVELLLQQGADPFVENIKSYTALDFACEVQNADLIRRLETQSLWCGWLVQKVPRLGGLGSEWQRRWVIVCYRRPSPFAPPNRRRTHVVLLCYKNLASTQPCCRAWLDGAHAVEVEHQHAAQRTGGRRPSQIKLKLHRKHPAPSGSYTTGNSREGFALHFRPDEGLERDCEALANFMAAVNRCDVSGQTSAVASGGGTDSRYSPLGQNAETNAHVGSTGAVGRPEGQEPRRGPLQRSADEELARRLQAEEDAELAMRLSRLGTTAAPLSQPSVSVDSFYPAINFTSTTSQEPPGSRPTMLQSEGASATSFAAAAFQGYGSYSSSASRPASEVAGENAEASGSNAPPAGEREPCCICLDKPIEAGFVHGDEMHACVCRECAQSVKDSSQRCPKCRQVIEKIVRVYY